MSEHIHHKVSNVPDGSYCSGVHSYSPNLSPEPACYDCLARNLMITDLRKRLEESEGERGRWRGYADEWCQKAQAFENDAREERAAREKLEGALKTEDELRQSWEAAAKRERERAEKAERERDEAQARIRELEREVGILEGSATALGAKWKETSEALARAEEALSVIRGLVSGLTPKSRPQWRTDDLWLIVGRVREALSPEAKERDGDS